MLIKIHTGYRKTIALSDKNLLNQTFTQDKMEITLHSHFFEGEEKNLCRVLGLENPPGNHLQNLLLT